MHVFALAPNCKSEDVLGKSLAETAIIIDCHDMSALDGDCEFRQVSRAANQM